MRATFIPSFFPKPPLVTRSELQALKNGGGASYELTKTKACAAGFPPHLGVQGGRCRDLTLETIYRSVAGAADRSALSASSRAPTCFASARFFFRWQRLSA
jgi:hypothetical protein